jgi:hypothetical protein
MEILPARTVILQLDSGPLPLRTEFLHLRGRVLHVRGAVVQQCVASLCLRTGQQNEPL